MDKPLDEALSKEIGDRIKSKAKAPFDNAHKAAIATEGATYVQGFVVFMGKLRQPIEHAWIEVGDRTIDPNLKFLNKKAEELHYFPAQRLSVQQLKAAIEEAKEDYPEDNPLPIYGSSPYEYYGDIMLGGKEYLQAYEDATQKAKELNRGNVDRN
ncbi:MAG TPA: hypothetical protein V6C78_26845 [Crinalium sp.]